MLPAIIGGSLSVVSGIFGAASAKKAAAAAKAQRKMLEAKLKNLENNRQEIINPYEGIQDLSAMMSNPFASLGVATGAAEMKIEEADISLANTLDLMRSTGQSAGGATALAQAALRSKKGVAASIEQQEARNEMQRAQGEATLNQQLTGEQRRLQQADVSGAQFQFNTRETRQMQELDRTSDLLSGAQNRENEAFRDETSAVTGMFGSLAGIAGESISMGA
jgi:CHASE2 domain-containing sensor protein|tara:strand:- start:890 stop:1552 length:663 start_codon:yes stop_codon:yes gene_type:complete